MFPILNKMYGQADMGRMVSLQQFERYVTGPRPLVATDP